MLNFRAPSALLEIIKAIIVILLPFVGEAQNTVGLLTYNAEAPIEDYLLIYPEQQSTAFLLDACGQIVHRWEDNDFGARPGAVAYLLPDGRLLRAKRYAPLFEGPTFGSGGAGGVVELVSWDNEVLWTYVVADSTERQHHDVHYLPNGHILILAYDFIEWEELIASGFDTLSYSQQSLWSEKIIEVDPLTDSIHWEWRAWDHLVQDVDETAENYGEVSAHPGRINLNYQVFTMGREDWIHANAIDYNEELDQIMISARNFNEVWIIDHSTTTAEAATNTGGNSNRGGELLWRWGSPHTYNQGTLDDQQLFSQHDAQWIDDFVSEDYPYYGAIAVFNNFINFSVEEGLSQGQIIAPVWETNTPSYAQEDGVFLPNDFSATFVHPDTAKTFSSNASSIQILDDGHVLMCVARQGRVFELDTEGTLVWEYLTPLRFGQPFPQGGNLNLGENFTFQAKKYPATFSAFIDKDLSPQGYLELNPDEAYCSIVAASEPNEEEIIATVFPNPSTGQFSVNVSTEAIGEMLTVSDLRGVLISQQLLKTTHTVLDLSNYPVGMYLLQVSGKSEVEKLMLIK